MRRGPLVISLLAGLAGLLALGAVAEAKPKRLPPQKEVSHKAPERLARRDDGLVAEPKGITWIVRPGQRAEEAHAAKPKPAKVRAVKRTAHRTGASRAGRVARARAR